MKYIFARDFRTEILELDVVFKNSLLPWWEDISGYIRRFENDTTWNMLPLVVLGVYKFNGLDRQISIAMANIFKTLYLANSIHALVKDDKEGQEYNRELQFSILIGDYISGRMLKLLVEAHADSLVGIFADMMAEISEGMVLQHKYSITNIETVEKTRGPLYARAFETAAYLAGFEKGNQVKYRQMGLALGMSMELLAYDSLHKEVHNYIHETEQIFKVIKQQNNTSNSTLEKVMTKLHGLLCNIDESAVV
ncbi:MAG: hypothetical protein PHC92_02345 [Syntrophomonadaceae bacterium]|nr:hypothetical protein [Syntrophomonadaceae bacterium]MDD3024782.1 hypothetical protein [Syntrophomonadaceae bacterium]